MSDIVHNAGRAATGTEGGLWDVKRAAEYLGMSSSWLYRKVEEGVVPAVRLGTGKRAPLRFRKTELDAWVARHGQAQGAA